MKNLNSLPNDLAAESGALGCIPADPSLAEQRLSELCEADFHDIRNLEVFRALTSLAFDNQPLEIVGLVQRLKDSGRLDDAGGFEYVSDLPNKTPSAESFPVFLDTVKDRTRRRAMLQEAKEWERAALDISTSIDRKPKSKLPAVQDAAEFTENELPEPRQVVWGVVHQGCKMALGGGSKTFKTWSLIDLALSVSHGEPWLSFKTTRARVCYVNLELPAWSVHSRLRAVAMEKRITIQPKWLDIWNLRGQATSYSEILPMLAAELSKAELGLLIVDPIYKLYGNTDENSARDVSNLLNEFERLAQRTGAAIAFASHFSKGNQASKEAVDRISGSGVFARDPDAILTFTRHETEGAFVVDSTLRNCKAVEPFVVRWQYPLMRCDDELDPAKLKQAKGRPSKYNADQLLGYLNCKGIETKVWQQTVSEETGMSRAQFYDFLKSLQAIKAVQKDTAGKWQSNKSKTPCLPSPENAQSNNGPDGS